jgi:hypothetical protein
MNPTPAPGLAFIRKIHTDERYRGSAIVIPEAARDKLAELQWEIVSVGAPEPCDDEDCERHHGLRFSVHTDETNALTHTSQGLVHPCDLAPGDWVLVRKRAESATPEPGLYVIRQSDVLGRFEPDEPARET